MKLPILLSITLLLVGCGSDSSDSMECAKNPIVGVWHSPNDTLTLEQSCDGRSNYCESEFVFTAEAPYASLYISTTNTKSGCPALGISKCKISLDAKNLSVDCGAGAVKYTR